MKASITACVTAAGLALSGAVYAADPRGGEALAKSSGCFACHTLDKKTVGPAYKEIAAKYRSSKSAEADLMKKVKAGGKGVWGEIPMPPNAHIKDADIRAMVQWILSIK